MLHPTIAYLVTRGAYDEYQPLAVFTEYGGAQDFADHHNLTTERYSPDDKAQVEQIDLYGPGWRRPAESDVPDGHTVPVHGPAPALGPRGHPERAEHRYP